MEFESIRESKYLPLSSYEMQLVKGGTRTRLITFSRDPNGHEYHDYALDGDDLEMI